MALIIVFVNKSDLAPISDYKYEVLVGDGTPSRSSVIAAGRIVGHTRSDGWKVLVQKMLDHVGGD